MAKRSQRKNAAGSGGSIKITSRDWWWGLLLALAVIAAYLPVWKADFIWDDDLLVTGNPCIVGPLGLKEIWTTGAADICPLTLTAFWMEHALWGLSPLPYHLVNVAMHAASAVLLWRILRNLRIPGAWLGAALWALHPVQVESAAWIAEMKNTQSGLFYLLSILFFVKGLRSKSHFHYGLMLLFAAMAMASKSSTVILPVILCLCAWWAEGRWHGRNLIRAAPVFLMSAVAAAASIWTQKLQLDADPQAPRSWGERLATAGDAVWFYLGKLLWPHPLMTLYPRWEIHAGNGLSYLPLLIMILVLFVLWANRTSWSRPWFFAWAYFLTALLPVMGLMNMSFFRYSFVADHFQYLAAMGPLALAGAGLVRLSEETIPGRWRLQTALGAELLLILGLLSWERAGVHKNQETLWTDNLAKNPDCWTGYGNLGFALFQKGRTDEAIVLYRKALKLNPDLADAHDNLGIALAQKGQADEAIAQFQTALALHPRFAEAHYNLALALAQKGRAEEAITQFRRALEINPLYAAADNNLGFILFQKGQVDEAIAYYQKALMIKPDFAEACNNLGIALIRKGQLNEAIAQFQKAVALKPDDGNAQNNLAKARAMVR